MRKKPRYQIKEDGDEAFTRIPIRCTGMYAGGESVAKPCKGLVVVKDGFHKRSVLRIGWTYQEIR